jgi:predicted transcriptional regulator
MADTSDLILAPTATVVAACFDADVVASAVVPNLIKDVQRVLRDLSSLGLGERSFNHPNDKPLRP